MRRNEPTSGGQRGIWVRMAIAYALVALLALTWAKYFASGLTTEEDMSVGLTMLTLLSALLGIPALLLALIAWGKAGRLSAGGSRTTTRRVNALLGLLAVLAVAGAVAIQANVSQQRNRVGDHATASVFDRSGLATINHRGHWYRNPNDRCSPVSGGPPTTISPCTPQNRPPVRTRAWLVAHHAWPLLKIGEVQYSAANMPGGTTHQIYRPAGQQDPAILLVSNGSTYLEYRRS